MKKHDTKEEEKEVQEVKQTASHNEHGRASALSHQSDVELVPLVADHIGGLYERDRTVSFLLALARFDHLGEDLRSS